MKKKKETPKPPKYGKGWIKEGKEWVNKKTGERYYYHPEDETHWAHWDVKIPGGKKRRIPIDPEKGVFKDRNEE